MNEYTLELAQGCWQGSENVVPAGSGYTMLYTIVL